MPHNLNALSTNPSDPRPHQTGKAIGTKAGLNVTVSIEWLVDSGAQITCVTKGTGDKFDLTATAASASATTGGGGLIIKQGLTTEFEIFDTYGSPQKKGCSLDVAVKNNNSGSEILGMDQLEDVGANLEWNPKSLVGRLYEP